MYPARRKHTSTYSASDIESPTFWHPNTLAQAGDRVLYVQVINPDNNIIGDKSNITFGQDLLTYSKSESVFYENQALDVCAIVGNAGQDVLKGLYTINIFDAQRQIGSTTLMLK